MSPMNLNQDKKAELIAKAIVGSGVVIGFLALAAIAIIVGPYITQWAWHHFATPVFGLREITWTEAFALNLLGSVFGRPNIKFGRGK